jgi:hypothetical protein
VNTLLSIEGDTELQDTEQQHHEHRQHERQLNSYETILVTLSSAPRSTPCCSIPCHVVLRPSGW